MRRYRTRARFRLRKTASTDVTGCLPAERIRIEGDRKSLGRRKAGEPTEELRIVRHRGAPAAQRSLP